MLLLFEILSQGDRKDTFARSTLAGMLLLFDVMNQGDRLTVYHKFLVERW